jgi:YfiH family protein
MFRSKKLMKFKGLNHRFFTRKGGFSKGLYKGLNCGRGSKDNKKNIYKNLNYVSKIMRVSRNNLFLMHQTHSNKVIEIKNQSFKKKINSDAMITRVKGIGLGVVTADCVPILVYDKKNEIIGCIHAGWKGALSGVVKNTIDKIKIKGKTSNIFATIGPCIGKKSYEVDLNFYKRFLKKSQKYKRYFSYKNQHKKLFDLRKFISDRLEELDVIVDHINRDTFAEKKNFYSFRRSFKLKQNDYGRCISVISLI